jgi:sulfonate transport system substrate-binding protein
MNRLSGGCHAIRGRPKAAGDVDHSSHKKDTIMHAQRRILTFFLLLISLVVVTDVARADKPTVIRIAFPAVGIGNRPVVGGSPIGTVGLRGMLEEEFKADGIRIQWTYLPGAGPAVNELFANGLADFGAGLGDLPSIIGKSGGLKTRILAGAGIRQHTYLAVPADSPIKTIEDLRGKQVAYQKGTNIQLAVARIIAAHGLTEHDFRAINMDNETAKSAIITHSVDAAFGQYDYLQLRDQGTAKILYVANGEDNPGFLKHSSLVVSDDFATKYPDITERVVKVLVQAAKFQSEADDNRTAIFSLWTKSGVPFNDWKEDLQKNSLKQLASPLLDDYFRAQYKRAVDDSKRFGLIRGNVDVDRWIDPSFLQKALHELNLETYWQPYDANGQAHSS